MSAAPALHLGAGALLLVDLQRDFVHPDGAFAGWHGLDAGNRGALLANCQRLIEAMHGAERPVIHITTELRSDYADAALPGRWIAQARAAATPALVEGSWGAGLMDGITLDPRDFVVVKKGLAAFQHTNLDRLLMTLGVRQCVLAGGSVTGAISSTVRLGAALGYEQYVVGDAVYPSRPSDLETLRNRVAFTTTKAVAQTDAGTPSAEGEAPDYALIVVDIQNDFVHPQGAMHRYGHSEMDEAERQQILANNSALAAAMRAHGWPVIYVRDVQTWHGRDTVLGPMMRRAIPMPPEAAFIKEGTWGADLVDGLGIEESDLQVVKRGNSAFGFTPLHRTLRNLGVRHCLVTGGAVIGCLSDTIREGVGLGYDMTIVADAVYPPSDPYLTVLGELGDLRPTQSVLDELAAGP